MSNAGMPMPPPGGPPGIDPTAQLPGQAPEAPLPPPPQKKTRAQRRGYKSEADMKIGAHTKKKGKK